MKGEVVATLGKFTVYKGLGREWLYCGNDEVAQCINGDHVARHGGLDRWVEWVNKRSKKRLKKINEQLNDLLSERECLRELESNCIDARLEARAVTDSTGRDDG